jgi:amino acid permease
MTASEEDIEKKGVTAVEPAGDRSMPAYDDVAVGTTQISPLKRSLQGRHMQMIAIGMCFVDRFDGSS